MKPEKQASGSVQIPLYRQHFLRAIGVNIHKQILNAYAGKGMALHEDL